MSAKLIVAVAFVIERDGAILMLRRSRTKDHAPDEWEFGSGRVEYGEHPEDAVHREVRDPREPRSGHAQECLDIDREDAPTERLADLVLGQALGEPAQGGK